MSSNIVTKTDGAVCEIILNRPDKRNALSLEAWAELDAAVQAAERQPGLRCVVFRGEGKGFSAGIDLASFLRLQATYGSLWHQRMRSITADFQAVTTRIERLEVPTIALLHGFCLGLGLELALACDFRLGADDVKLGLPETQLGMIPDVGGTTRLTRLIGVARAKAMIFTGSQIDAVTAERYGLLQQVVPAAELPGAAAQWVEAMQRSAPLAIGMAKRVIDGASDQPRGLDLEGWAQSQLFQTEDFREAMQAFADKRAPVFRGR